jgi:hypothetical protein
VHAIDRHPLQVELVAENGRILDTELAQFLEADGLSTCGPQALEELGLLLVGGRRQARSCAHALIIARARRTSTFLAR